MIYFFDNCISWKVVEILRLAGAEDGPGGEDAGPHELIHIQEVEDLPRRGDTSDIDWMPYVAKQGWTAVTSDHRIRKKPQERAVFLAAKLAAVFISRTVTESRRWDQTKFFVNHWLAIAKHTNRCAPGDLFLVDAHGGVDQMQPLKHGR